MFRYVHTNIIAKDLQKLIKFYKNVFQCRSIGETRDLCGEWLDKLTGIHNSHIVGEHLCLPGYEKAHPTLEIFSYDIMEDSNKSINKCGIAHIAFEVDNVEKTLQLLKMAEAKLAMWSKQNIRMEEKQFLFMHQTRRETLLNCKAGHNFY